MTHSPGWIGPRDPAQPNLNIGTEDGSVINCTFHDMGDCPHHTPPEPELTDAEKLAALETYIKVLTPMAKALRAKVTEDLAARRVEKVGAYLPGGVKIASVSYVPGGKTAKVTDPHAAARWCARAYPHEMVHTVNPAFLTALTDYAKKQCEVGEHGVDPHTGQELTFIDVVQGSPYVRVTTTDEGVDRMAALAGGFTAMLEGGN